MKKTILLRVLITKLKITFLFIIFFSKSYAQNNIEINAYIVWDNQAIEYYLDNSFTNEGKDTNYYVINKDKEVSKLSRNSKYATKNAKIIIEFTDTTKKRTNPSSNHFQKAEISKYNIIKPNAVTGKNVIIIDLYELGDKPERNEIVNLQITHKVLNDSNQLITKNNNFYFNYKKYWEPYSRVSMGTWGVWLPYGLFAASVDTKNNGILLSSIPIGFAFGTKRNYSKTKIGKYIGFSLICSYNITGNITKENDNTSKLIHDISLGILFDISNKLYIGLTQPLNLTGKNVKYSPQLIVGFALKWQNSLNGNLK